MSLPHIYQNTTDSRRHFICTEFKSFMCDGGFGRMNNTFFFFIYINCLQMFMSGRTYTEKYCISVGIVLQTKYPFRKRKRDR